MTADDARQFLQSLNVFMSEDCYESDIDEDSQKVIALVDVERERCSEIARSFVRDADLTDPDAYYDIQIVNQTATDIAAAIWFAQGARQCAAAGKGVMDEDNLDPVDQDMAGD